MNIGRIVLVTKPTVLEELVARDGTRGNAEYLLRSRGDSIERFVAQHDEYLVALEMVERDFPRGVEHTHCRQSDVPHFLFRPNDLVVVVGPNGLFVNVAKYLDGQLVLTVNPDERRFESVIMRATPQESGVHVRRILSDEVQCDEIVLAEATTPEEGRLRAVNDFLFGRRDPLSARYSITHRGRTERQSSSGVLISTGMGATGWLRSIRKGIDAASGGKSKVPADPLWNEGRLVFAVREPFPSSTTGTSLVYGEVSRSAQLTLVSEMPEGGCVFSDGMFNDALLLPAGLSLTIGIARERVRLVRLK